MQDEQTRTITPAHALAAETLPIERKFRDLTNQAYALSPAEIALMWKTAPSRMPFLPPTTCAPSNLPQTLTDGR